MPVEYIGIKSKMEIPNYLCVVPPSHITQTIFQDSTLIFLSYICMIFSPHNTHISAVIIVTGSLKTDQFRPFLYSCSYPRYYHVWKYSNCFLTLSSGSAILLMTLVIYSVPSAHVQFCWISSSWTVIILKLYLLPALMPRFSYFFL